MTKINFAFICGAQRSGTSLLSELLDSHPNTYVCPIESVIYYYWNLHNATNSLESFFLRDFLNTNEVLWLTDARTRKNLVKFTADTYGHENVNYPDTMDRAEFINNYLEVIKTEGLSLRSVFLGLFKAIFPSEIFENNNGWFIEKSPMDNEIGAVMLNHEFQNARFIHIVRDPRTRYNSAKIKRIRRPSKFYLRYTTNMYEKDFATALAQNTMTSMMLAKLNKEILKEKYLIIRYEDLIKTPEIELRKVADHLSIKFDDVLLTQTRLGKEARPLSSIDLDMSSGVKDTSAARLDQFFKNTSRLERDILNYFTWEIAQEFNYEIEPVDKINFSSLMLPLKWENPKDFIGNRLRMLFTLRGNPSFTRTNHFHELLLRFHRGERI